MTTKGFVVTHARDAQFQKGLRAFFEYRDLMIEQATGGRVLAHGSRAPPVGGRVRMPHDHDTLFQLA